MTDFFAPVVVELVFPKVKFKRAYGQVAGKNRKRLRNGNKAYPLFRCFVPTQSGELRQGTIRITMLNTSGFKDLQVEGSVTI